MKTSTQTSGISGKGRFSGCGVLLLAATSPTTAPADLVFGDWVTSYGTSRDDRGHAMA